MRKSLILLGFIIVLGGAYTIEQYLNIRGNGGGWFLPGGREIIIVNNTSGVNQAWRMATTGGWATQITFLDEGIDGIAVHPVTGKVILSADRVGTERTQLYVMNSDGTDLTALTQNPKVVYELGDWSRDGRIIVYASNERDERYFDIYMMDLETRQSQQLLQQDGYNSPVALSPDGSKLIFYRAHGALDGDLYLLELKRGVEGEPVQVLGPHLLTAHKGNLQVGAAAWDANNAGFYYTSDQDRQFTGLAYYDLAKGKTRWILMLEHDVEAVQVSWTGKYLLWTENLDGYNAVHIKDLTTGKEIATPFTEQGLYYGFNFSADDSMLTYGYSSPTEVGDVHLWRIGEATAQQVTQPALAGISPQSFATSRLITYPTFDGRQIPAWLYLPVTVNPGAKLPVIVMAHGGPQVQERPWFNPIAQYFLNAGYAVLAPNVRGSSGYGKAYADADNLGRRYDSVKDFYYGWKWLTAQPWCDLGRIAIHGGSYGGFIVLAELTTYPEAWAAGVDICGIANFKTYLENTGKWRVELREDEYGYLKDTEMLAKISPINFIQNIRAPLMVIQGANDPRVPAEEAEQIVTAAKQQGVKVEYLLYDDEGHGLSKRKNRLDAYPKMVKFLEEAMVEKR
jgi:dipeptidyl aminopeptidase/acylaminoacyl peptidase